MSNESQNDLEPVNSQPLEPEPDITIDLSELGGFPDSPVAQDGAWGGDARAGFALSPEVAARNLNTLRRAVRRFWVIGGLCSSLHNELMIRMGIQQERRVMYPSLWNMTYQQADLDVQTFDDTDALLDAFNQSGQQMVILGADGGGKTTALLQIAEELSEPNEEGIQLVPVVFNLATWSNKFPRLLNWLIHELIETYHMPKEAAQTWIQNNELLVLLDGLDEVAEAQRVSCVWEINEFHQNHAVGIAVTCSDSVYEALDTPINFNGTLRLDPYTPEQIVDYIDDAEEQLAGMSQLLTHNSELTNLAITPLYLTILSLIHSEQPELLTDLPRRPNRTPREHLLDLYIWQMLRSTPRELAASESGGVMPYLGSDDKSMKWLRWLATRMGKGNQSLFQIENVQRTAFIGPLLNPVRMLASWLMVVLFVIAVGSLFWLAGFPPVAGFLFGAFFAYILRAESILKEPRSLLANFEQLRNRRWRALFRFAPLLFFAMFIVGANLVVLGLIAVVMIVIIWFLFGDAHTVHPQVHQRPNQGTWLSLYTALTAGASIALLAGLALGIVYLMARGQFLQGAFIGLVLGVAGALFCGLYRGIVHLVARMLLNFSNRVPWKYSRFLDYAASRLLLRKIGGSYTFAHPILREHIANLSDSDIEWITSNHAEQ